jgi:transcriptional regulator with XRE-family HTH domain
MHVRTFYRQRRGDRTLAEAAEATGINEGTLSRIERGEQFPRGEDQVYALANFYDPRVFREVALPGDGPAIILSRLYPASVLRCIQLERNCVDCGKTAPREVAA